MSFSSWIDHHFFLIQTAGIIGTLVFTALSVRQGTKARMVSDLLTLSERHFELWKEMKRPELSRILAKEVNFIENPLTVAEERFLNEVIVYFSTGWLVARCGALFKLGALKPDVKAFFTLPLPRKVWEQSKQERDPAFVKFVEKCLKTEPLGT